MSGANAATFVTAAANLAAERTLITVLASLRQYDIDAIALKGPAQARWLYGTPRRSPLDIDVLVAPANVSAAGTALHALGYSPYLDRGDGGGTDYAQTWQRDGSVTVDLHWSLAGADPRRLWPALHAASEETTIGAVRMRIPTVPGRALIIALHAAQHGRDELHVIDDLARALEIVDADTWGAAATLSRRAGAEESFAAGMRLLPAGVALAGRLKLTLGTTPEVEIRRAGEPHTALAFERLARTPGARQKARMLGCELVPPTAFMRDWTPLARRGRVGLTLAYLSRALWLTRRAPRGYLTWRRAKRASERSRTR